MLHCFDRMNTALGDAQKLYELLLAHKDNVDTVLPKISEERVKEGNSLTDLAFHLYCLDTATNFRNNSFGGAWKPLKMASLDRIAAPTTTYWKSKVWAGWRLRPRINQSEYHSTTPRNQQSHSTGIFRKVCWNDPDGIECCLWRSFFCTVCPGPLFSMAWQVRSSLVHLEKIYLSNLIGNGLMIKVLLPCFSKQALAIPF